MLELYLGRVGLRFSFSFFLLLAVLLLWDNQLLLLPVLFAVLLHELGHLLALHLCGGEVRGVCFTGSGIHIRQSQQAGGLRAELLVHLSGVAVNLLLAGIFYLWPGGFYGAYFSAVNLLLGLFHLIPAGNLDGANALRSVLARRCSEQRARQLLLAVSLCCLAALLWGMLHLLAELNLSAAILWCYLLFCTFREY